MLFVTLSSVTVLVSDLGFPARGAMHPSQQFFRGTFLFWEGHCFFFYSNVPGVRISANVIFSGFGSCFPFGNLLKLKPKYYFKKILHEDKLHFLVSFSFGKQFEERQSDPDRVFEGDIFAQTAAIP